MRPTRISDFPDHAARQLAIKRFFDALPPKDRLYADYMTRAAWHGTRIILRQASSEATGIFDFIMDLYRACDGQWSLLIDRCGITAESLKGFLEYAARFLCNIGNYYGEGGQKFAPDLPAGVLRSIASVSSMASDTLKQIIEAILSMPPFSLGLPTTNAQSGCYPGEESMTLDEMAKVNQAMEEHSIEAKNTRLRKVVDGGKLVFEVLQASVECDAEPPTYDLEELGASMRLVRGDHAEELFNICSALSDAIDYIDNTAQAKVIADYIQSFQTGNLQAFYDGQKSWVADISPRIEHYIAFSDTSRDPYGARAEWEGVVFITNTDEVSTMERFVEKAPEFVSLLPWAEAAEDGSNGPWEKETFEVPDFMCVSAIAFCASYIWQAASLPNDSDIRESHKPKAMLVTNTVTPYNIAISPYHFVRASDADGLKECAQIIKRITTVTHEFLGHGTGRLLGELAPGDCNFDIENPPINPLTDQPIDSWYLAGETEDSVFEDLEQPVEECRAILVSYYIMDNKELLSVFGYTDSTPVTADDLTYFAYLQVGVEGLQALERYVVDIHAWSDPKSRAHFAILKYLILDGGDVLTIDHDRTAQTLTVRVDRSKILSDGKPALEGFLQRMHVFLCTADVDSCREFYTALSQVRGKFETWRQIVCSKAMEPGWKFVQPNTVLEGGGVVMKIYEESNEGIIQSWAERDV